MLKTNFRQDELQKIADTIITHASSKVIAFYGPMGAGKTTLIKTMIQQLGAEDAGHSPTFGLVNEYHDKNGRLLAYHFDFYRIENEEEAYDLGLEDYFNSDAWLLIEWPEKIKSLLPSDHQRVFLQFIDEKTRSIEF